MQHLEHNQPVESTPKNDRENKCSIIVPGFYGGPGACNTDYSISYGLTIHDMTNSYDTTISAFTEQATLIDADVTEAEINEQVN